MIAFYTKGHKKSINHNVVKVVKGGKCMLICLFLLKLICCILLMKNSYLF